MLVGPAVGVPRSSGIFGSSGVAAAPTVSSISPNTGTTAGGTAVTITGTNLTGATLVAIGGVACTSVVVVGPTSITAVTGANSAATDNVSVTTPGGTGTGTGLFTYQTPASSILDGLATAPTAAYSSIRLLRTAYAGAALRVRRSTDNTEQDIGFVSGLLDTASMLTFCAGGNGFITKLYDQMGNTARNQVQATQANQPQIVSAGTVITTINSNPSMQYNGTSQYLLGTGALSTYVTAGAYTIMTLSRPTAGGPDTTPLSTGADPMLVCDLNDQYLVHGWGLNAGVFGHYPAGSVACPTTYPSVNVALQSYDGATIGASLNGGAPVTLATSIPIQVLTHAVGLGAGYTTMHYFTGTACEIVLWNAVVAKADKNTMGASMAALAGATWTTIP